MHLSSQVSHHYLYSFMDIVLKEQHSSRTQEQADERTSTSRATESECECHRWLPRRWWWPGAPRRRLAPSGIRLGLLRAAPWPRPRSAHNTRPEETVGHQEKKELEKRKPVSLWTTTKPFVCNDYLSWSFYLFSTLSIFSISLCQSGHCDITFGGAREQYISLAHQILERDASHCHGVSLSFLCNSSNFSGREWVSLYLSATLLSDYARLIADTDTLLGRRKSSPRRGEVNL